MKTNRKLTQELQQQSSQKPKNSKAQIQKKNEQRTRLEQKQQFAGVENEKLDNGNYEIRKLTPPLFSMKNYI
jgi:hypothetical protein